MRETFFFSYIFLLHHLVIIVVDVVVVKRSFYENLFQKNTPIFASHFLSPRVEIVSQSKTLSSVAETPPPPPQDRTRLH